MTTPPAGPGGLIVLESEEGRAVLQAAERLLDAALENRSGVRLGEAGWLLFDAQEAQTAFERLERVFEERISESSRLKLEQATGLPIGKLVTQAVHDWLYSTSGTPWELGLRQRRFAATAFLEDLVGRVRASGRELVIRGDEHGERVAVSRRWGRVPVLALLGGSLGYVLGAVTLLLWRASIGLRPTEWGTLLGAMAFGALGLRWTLQEPSERCSECSTAVHGQPSACGACGASFTRGGDPAG